MLYTRTLNPSNYHFIHLDSDDLDIKLRASSEAVCTRYFDEPLLYSFRSINYINYLFSKAGSFHLTPGIEALLSAYTLLIFFRLTYQLCRGTWQKVRSLKALHHREALTNCRI